MKTLNIEQILLLALTTSTFTACIKHEKVTSSEAMETVSTTKQQTQSQIEPLYGLHTDRIEELLSTTPMGSVIYLEEKESGEWYLKIEKTFTAKKDEKKSEILEPIYGESILI